MQNRRLPAFSAPAVSDAAVPQAPGLQARCQVYIWPRSVSGYHTQGALNPHITFWPRRPSVFCSLHRRLACLQHMASVQQFMQMAIQDGRAAACALNRPVCHILAADVYAVTLEFLLHAAERERIDVFAIDGRCLKGRRNHAVTQQILRTACLHDEIRIAICRLNAAVLLYITEHKPAPP